MKRRPLRAPVFALVGLFAVAASGAGPPNQDSAALPTPPKEARRAFDKAAAALKAKQIDEALRDYQQAVAIFPGYAEAWYELGKLQQSTQQPDAARADFAAAIHADPKSTGAFLA